MRTAIFHFHMTVIILQFLEEANDFVLPLASCCAALEFQFYVNQNWQGQTALLFFFTSICKNMLFIFVSFAFFKRHDIFFGVHLLGVSLLVFMVFVSETMKRIVYFFYDL